MQFSRSTPAGKWQHDRYENGGGARFAGGLRTGGGGGGVNAQAKLVISNLDFNVSDSDIEELFGEFGALRRASIHYDRSGRSLGTADVVFERRVDAQRALNQYNDVPLDGRPMKIAFAGAAVAAVANGNGRVAAGGGGGMRGVSQGARSGGGVRGNRARGGGGGVGGGGRGARQAKPNVTAADLDKELDAYVNKMEA